MFQNLIGGKVKKQNIGSGQTDKQTKKKVK